MNQTFTIDLNVICSNCKEHHAIAGTLLCPHCTPAAVHDPDRSQSEHHPQKLVRGLAGSLLDLIVRAEKTGDHQFHVLHLQRCLIIEVGIGQEFNLRLARRDAPPSGQEWQTVVAALPAAYKPETAQAPREFKHTARDGSSKWYLDGHWTMRIGH